MPTLVSRTSILYQAGIVKCIGLTGEWNKKGEGKECCLRAGGNSSPWRDARGHLATFDEQGHHYDSPLAGSQRHPRALRDLGPRLTERGWYVIAPDLRGRGWSGKPPHGYGIPYHVNDLLALTDALGLQ